MNFAKGLIVGGLIGWAVCYLQACIVMWDMEDVEDVEE